jgi:large subunit ribosomal protein L24
LSDFEFRITKLPEITKLRVLRMRTVSTVHKRVDIRRNDTVKVITGRDKGKEGRVLRVFPDDSEASGRARDDGEKACAAQPAAQHQGRHCRAGEPDRLSNVQLVCPTCGPVRIGHEVRGDRKVRVCKKCGTTLDK